jgi:TRAP-type C4-dicarboxylate transport system substrate-binding protein
MITRKPVRHLAEFKGMKIRVLASPFQLEMIKRMDASPVAMTLGDVLPALQQGAIDGALGTIPVYGPLHYRRRAKYVVEIGQPYVNTIACHAKNGSKGCRRICRKSSATMRRKFPRKSFRS